MTAQPLPASGSQRRRAARDEPASGKTLLVYTLHCGNLYGTERMALTTLASLRELGSPLVLSPEGPVREEAGRMGIVSRPFRGRAGLFAALARALLTHRRVVVFTTSIQHSWMCSLLAGVLRNRLAHLHVVHGGAPDEAGSYGHKRLLNPLDVRLVVVSEFGRERLLEHGVRGDKISVIGNFLTDRRIAECPRHPPFVEAGIKRWVIVSRLDPLKRVDVLLDALERHPDLRELEFRVLGAGPQREALARRAAAGGLRVRFDGFAEDVQSAVAEADGLLHLCPVESFGLVVLEGMAARVPVLVPDQGGTRTIVDPGVSGFQFPANDADGLAAMLRRLATLPAHDIRRVVDAAAQRLVERYSETSCRPAYQALIERAL